jgi:hypothetical protein
MSGKFTSYPCIVASGSQVSSRPMVPGSEEGAGLLKALSDSELLELQDTYAFWLEMTTDELQLRAEEQQRKQEAA